METRQYEVAVSSPGAPDPVSHVTHVGSAISWRAIFAGSLVGVLFYLALAALGLAFGGLSAEQAIEAREGAMAIGIGAGIWLVLSVLVSLFFGGYFAARASGVIPTRIGGIEGLVVASLFFVLMLTGIGAGMTAVGRNTASLVSSLGGGAISVAQNERVQSVVEGALGDLDLRSEPTQVVQGVASRLVKGDEQGAVGYLARQAGISQAQAQAKLSQVKGQVMGVISDVGQAAARATQIAGWVLFGMILLGSLAALFGGTFGARRNIKQPLSDRDRKVAVESRPRWSVHEERVPRTPAPPAPTPIG